MTVQILTGDCRNLLRSLPANSVQCVVTSPPYFGLRDYGVDGQIGLEETPDAFVNRLVDVFREVRRVLRDDGTLWLNIGDSYAGSGKGRNADGSHQEGGKQGTNRGTIVGSLVKTDAPNCKPKDLIGIPWMLAFALRADGWYLRQDIIWHKPNPMPESVRDRCTKSHEYVFLLTKADRYFFNADAIAEDAVKTGTEAHVADVEWRSRNKRSVWSIATAPFAEAHFATFPPELPTLCIKAGSRPGDTVLDPFGGAGTTGLVADRLGRHAILCELNPTYAAMARRRIEGDAPLFVEVFA